MNITLYQFESCPYCAKVRSVLDRMNLPYKKVEMARERDDPKRREIAKASGVQSVPVIEIDGNFIGESERIIGHLHSLKQ